MQSVLTRTAGFPRKRLDGVYDLCKGKNICEGGDEIDGDYKKDGEDQAPAPVDENKKPTHGGCGRYQPKYRRTGITLTAEWKKTNEDTQEKKITITAERILEVFKGPRDFACYVVRFFQAVIQAISREILCFRIFLFYFLFCDKNKCFTFSISIFFSHLPRGNV